jgi:hypothetical protein
MKKVNTLLCLVYLFIMTTPVTAQVNIGIKGGATISTVDFNFSRNGNHSLGGYQSTSISDLTVIERKYQNVQGYCFAFSVQKKLTEKLGLQLEVQYDQKGFHEFVSAVYLGTNYSQDLSTRFTYIDLPILLDYNLFKKGKFEINGLGGLNIGYALLSEQTYSAFGDSRTYKYELTSNNFNRVDLSLVGGVGFCYYLGGNALTLDTRYAFGLSSTELSDVLNKSQNRVISLLLGYRLALRR